MSNELTDYQLVVKVRCHGETLDELQEQISQTIAEYVDADTDTFDIEYVPEAARPKITELLAPKPEVKEAIFTPAHYDEEEGGVDASLVCPDCGNDIYERDVALRWNQPNEWKNGWSSDKPEGYRMFSFTTDGDYQFDGDGFFCSGCMKDVSLPEDLDITYD